MIGMIATPFLPCSNCQLSNCWRPLMFQTECVSCLLSCLVSHFGFVKAVGGWGTGGDLEGRRFCDLQTSNTCSPLPVSPWGGLMFPSLCSRPALFVRSWEDKDRKFISKEYIQETNIQIFFS